MSWTENATPAPVGARSAALASVSCASATACVAVGTAYLRNASAALVERWDGAHWTLLPAVNAGSRQTSLSSVWCGSARSCVAVGTLHRHNTSQPLVAVWSGRRWSVDRISMPAGAIAGGLNGVSCVSTTSACTAVGFAQYLHDPEGSYRPLVASES